MSPMTRKLAIALCVSLALNLFLAGFLAARAAFGRRPHGPRDPRGPFAAMMEGEPGEADVVREVMRRHHDALRGERSRLRDARREVTEALAADPFERARLERALAETRAHTAASQRAMHDALVEIVDGLEPEQRGRFARRALRREWDQRERGRGRPDSVERERREGVPSRRDHH